MEEQPVESWSHLKKNEDNKFNFHRPLFHPSIVVIRCHTFDCNLIWPNPSWVFGQMELGSDKKPYFPSGRPGRPFPPIIVQLQYHNLKYIAFITSLISNDVHDGICWKGTLCFVMVILIIMMTIWWYRWRFLSLWWRREQREIRLWNVLVPSERKASGEVHDKRFSNISSSLTYILGLLNHQPVHSIMAW